MLTISKPLSSGQAQTYHAKEFTSAEQNYWKQGDSIPGEWQGRMAEKYGLAGAIDAQHFARLSEGQNPHTAEQWVRHRNGQEYTAADGSTVKPVEHRAGWDATFSAPKSVSLTALVGGDDRIREAHRQAVTTALTELERYTQARIGGNHAAETTGNFIAAKFEHDTARPVDGYAAPQLHTHAVIFNMTERADGSTRAIQPQSYFDSQQFATAVYQSELTYRLRNLGYEIQPGKSGAPEIAGYSQAYLDASSPRRQQIEEAIARSGYSGPEAAQIAAHNTRDKKEIHTPAEVLAAHRQIAAEYGNQADRVVVEASERAHTQAQDRVPDASLRVQEAVTFAKERNFELTYAQVRDNFAHRHDTGEFQTVPGQKHETGRHFTTRETIAAELATIAHMQRGQNSVEPIMQKEQAADHAATRDFLNPAQRAAIEEILTTRDRIHGLHGLAGTGKTTTLEAIREGAARNGYAVEGFAPTGRAAHQLRDAGISADTLQSFLVRGGQQTAGDPNSRHLYMVDESSLASTRQMQAFLEKTGPQDRVLLIGDTRQHQSVDAGKPFEQMQQAGMRTAQLDTIMRQKDPELLRAVEHLSRNETTTGISLLQQQGRITEIPDRAERVAAIAREYAARQENTLVVSPDNASRREINQAIRAELQRSGIVSKDNHSMEVLTQRSDLTNVERSWAAKYQPDDVLYYTRGSKEHGIERGSYATVVSANAKDNQVTVERSDGQHVTYDPKRLQGITAYREITREFSRGDRIQFTAGNRDLRVSNRDLGTIERIDGTHVTVRMDGDMERSVRFDAAQMRHFDHGYAVTSHSSQGLTADRVLVNMDTTTHPELINTRFAYVSVSRAAQDARIFTNDAAVLGERLSTDMNKTSAIDLQKPQPDTPTHQQIPTKEPAMDNSKEQSKEKQRQQRQEIPATIYADLLPKRIMEQDIRDLTKAATPGNEVAAERVEARHSKWNSGEIPAITGRYIDRVKDALREHPERTAQQHIAALKPSAEDKAHWLPLAQALDYKTAETFTWKGENGPIQSYRSEETNGWLHIDRHGDFYDRHAQPITRENALEQVGKGAAVNMTGELSNAKGVGNNDQGISL
jgi:conjugative relaxase-like TrwC/TraI family protein